MPVKPPSMLAKPSSKIFRSCAVALMATEWRVNVVLPPFSVKVAVFNISAGHSGLKKWRVTERMGPAFMKYNRDGLLIESFVRYGTKLWLAAGKKLAEQRSPLAGQSGAPLKSLKDLTK